MTRRNRALLGIPAALAAAAGAVAVLASACGARLLYYPTHSPPEGLTSPGWVAESLTTADGERLRGVVSPARAEDAPWVLFFGGNAMSLADSRDVLAMARGRHDWGLAVFAYRGYDGSSGEPSERVLVEDAEAAAAFLRQAYGVESRRLWVMGQSLGTGVAVQLAAARGREHAPLGGLVLLAPYTSMTRVFSEAVSWLPSAWLAPDPFDSLAVIDAVSAPTLIIHGRQDTLIRVEHGRELASALGPRARLVERPGLGHNELWSDPRVVDEIARFVSGAAQ